MKWKQVALIVFFTSYASVPVSANAVETPDNDAVTTFDRIVAPFLDDYCLNCHDDSLHRGDVILSELGAQTLVQDAAVWQKLAEQVSHRTMPPADRKQPSEDERLKISAWIQSQLTTTFAAMPKQPGPALTRRLTAAEFDRTVRDLTGLDLKPARYFPSDGGGGEGFSNNASTLFVSPLLMEKIVAASQEIADHAVVSWSQGLAFSNNLLKSPDRTRFSEAWMDLLQQRGVFTEDKGRLAKYLELMWLFDYQSRKNRKLTLETFAAEHQIEPVFLQRLKQIFYRARAPLGATPELAAMHGVWGQTRRIGRRVAFDQQQARVRELAQQCAAILQDNPKGCPPYFGDAASKRLLIEENDPDKIESLIFHLPPEALLNSLKGETRRRFRGLWIQSQLEDGGREAQLEAERFAGDLLADFAQRAWRRPLDDAERAEFIKLHRIQIAQHRIFEDAVRIGVRSIIVSPNFLFRFELGPASGQPENLTHYEMASRLSYFIWGSMPDEQLTALAAQEKLQDADVLRKQVKRMLHDERASALGQSFFGEWIGYENLLNASGPDSRIFPDWKPELASAMVEQARRTLTAMIQDDRPYTDLVEADYTYLNGELAAHLGVTGLHGENWRLVSTLGQERYGVLGLPAVHVMTSYPHRTSPVLRGDWVLSVLLGAPTPPPPADAGDLDEQAVTTAASLREQLVAHRAEPACATCHDRIDPLGFPLEGFDAVGRSRGSVDVKGRLPDGTIFEGPKGLSDVLLSKRNDLLRRQLVVKTMGYALGREIRLEDEPTVRTIQAALEKDPRFSVLFTEIVLSPAFRRKS